MLIFGSSGALGEGVTKVFIEKNYDRIYLFDFKHKNIALTNVKQIIVKDLSVEENVKKAFSEITPSKETIFFLFSTIGGFTGGKKIWETEIGDFDRMINMNLRTSFLISKYFFRAGKRIPLRFNLFNICLYGLNCRTRQGSVRNIQSSIDSFN